MEYVDIDILNGIADRWGEMPKKQIAKELKLSVKDLNEYAYKMANGVEDVNTDGLDVHWDALLEKYSFYNLNALVLKSAFTETNEIMADLLQLTEGEATMLEDVTQ